MNYRAIPFNNYTTDCFIVFCILFNLSSSLTQDTMRCECHRGFVLWLGWHSTPAPPGLPCRLRGRAMDESDEELKKKRIGLWSWERRWAEQWSAAMALQAFRGRPPPPPAPCCLFYPSTNRRSTKPSCKDIFLWYTHTCIQIRFLTNSFHVGTPACACKSENPISA